MSFKKKWLDGSLPLLVAYTPRDLNLNFVLPIANKSLFYYDLVTDEKVIVDEQISKGFYYIGGATMLIAIFILLLSWRFDWFIILLMSIGILFILYASIVPKKVVILDRQNGLITFPNCFFGKCYTIPFIETKAVWSGTGGNSGAIGMDLMVKHPNSIKGVQVGMHTKGFKEDWSFMVWYMDKNRPLPPGTAFDSFREKDFERRKFEGFPSPLYKSKVLTPEATASQQAERNKHWRDKEYYGVSESAWY